MARRWLLAMVLLLLLGSAPAAAGAQGLPLRVSGKVTRVDPDARRLELGTQPFHVPEGVAGFEALLPGMTVVIRYESVAGRAVVTGIESPEPD